MAAFIDFHYGSKGFPFGVFCDTIKDRKGISWDDLRSDSSFVFKLVQSFLDLFSALFSVRA